MLRVVSCRALMLFLSLELERFLQNAYVSQACVENQARTAIKTRQLTNPSIKDTLIFVQQQHIFLHGTSTALCLQTLSGYMSMTSSCEQNFIVNAFIVVREVSLWVIFDLLCLKYK